MAEALLAVSLCWSFKPRHVQEVMLRVPPGSSVQTVLDLAVAQQLLQGPTGQGTGQGTAQGEDHSALLASLTFQQPGIWGRKVTWSHGVAEGDRIELYRALKVDPKVARRQRFKRQGKGRTGLFAKRKSGVAAGY